MRVLRHFTANDEKLEQFPFRRELSMESYLVENEGILALDDPYIDVNVIAEELTLRQGRSSKDTDGRIDLLVTYAQEFIGIVELKLGQLKEIHLEQLEDYLESKQRILDEFPDIIPSDIAPSPKWIGLIVGNSIDEDLARKITNGYTTSHDGIPIAALTIQRFRSEKGNVYVVTESYFKNSNSNRDISKYIFESQRYGKGRLVLAVLKSFIAENPETTFSSLEKAFPKNLQGATGVFCTYDAAHEIYASTGRKRHFLNPDEVIQLQDIKIAVTNQWGMGNIDWFITAARNMGIEISQE